MFVCVVHRIGRTGRCGKTGIATTFINKMCGTYVLLPQSLALSLSLPYPLSPLHPPLHFFHPPLFTSSTLPSSLLSPSPLHFFHPPLFTSFTLPLHFFHPPLFTSFTLPSSLLSPIPSLPLSHPLLPFPQTSLLLLKRRHSVLIK